MRSALSERSKFLTADAREFAIDVDRFRLRKAEDGTLLPRDVSEETPISLSGGYNIHPVKFQEISRG